MNRDPIDQAPSDLLECSSEPQVAADAFGDRMNEDWLAAGLEPRAAFRETVPRARTDRNRILSALGAQLAVEVMRGLRTPEEARMLYRIALATR
ncbi:MAG TPA: hypothetical protein VEY91_01115 [Candidatus Limnocylindria bacterium]|nr:hypothetical protein [Candidatus Limnocylindria bacterium]